MHHIDFNYDNVKADVVSSKHGILPQDIKRVENDILKILSKLKKACSEKDCPEHSWINLPLGDPSSYIKFAKNVQKNYDTIIINGVGGATIPAVYLTKSISYDYWGEEAHSNQPVIHALNNIDPKATSRLLETTNFKKCLVISSSISGKTPETIANHLILRERLKKTVGEKFAKHIVAITNNEGGTLFKLAKKEGYHLFTVDQDACGRFSMLSVSGLLPSAIAGIDIKSVLEGAKKARKDAFGKTFKNNLPAKLAAIQYLMNTKKEKRILTMMCYSRQLFNFCVWYRQLIAESLSKTHDLSGNLVHQGITPMALLGTSDQHTQLQQIAEGPNDKYILFFGTKDFGIDLSIPPVKEHPDIEELSYLEKKSYSRLYHMYEFATKLTLAHNQRPNATLTLQKIDPETIGYLAFSLQMQIAILGKLYNIDYISHPSVDIVKNCTKAFLENKEL